MTETPQGNALPIIQYWHKSDIPPEVAKLLKTFGECNPSMHHMVFSEERAREFIGENFSAREVAAFDACAVPAMQADYFRYCAVLELGGVYVDADFCCLRPFQPLIEQTNGGMLFRVEPGNLINGFFLFETSGHPLLRLALDVATVNIERRAAQQVNVVTGPWIFTGLEILHRVGSIDAARQRAAGQQFEAFANSMLEAVVDYERVTEAFESLYVAPFSWAKRWIGNAESRLPYKDTEVHWVNWNRSGATIFRQGNANDEASS
jgi:mannosyltransferase OCH1-like enzyme